MLWPVFLWQFSNLGISLLHPIWLLLLIPLLAIWSLWPLSSRLLQWLRLTTLILIVLAMCEPVLRMAGNAGILVVIADRSRSMELSNSLDDQQEIIDLLCEKMPAKNKLAIVSVGSKAVLERPPKKGAFEKFNHMVEADRSNLTDGIEKALSLIPKGTRGRLLVLSDGQWTGRSPIETGSQALAREINIDYRLSQTATNGDISIAQLNVPKRVYPGEVFMISAWVYSPMTQEVDFQLFRGNSETPMVKGRKKMVSGLNRLVFRDIAGQNGGAHNYRLKVNLPNGKDPVPQNNQAKILVGVKGAKPVLCVTKPGSGLVKTLRAGGVNVIESAPKDCVWTLETLSGYSAVILENVSAQKIGERGLANIAAWVKDSGGGLMMTGGENSYAPGGYYRSPLEKILPLSMELRREHRKLSLAIVVALDRSGSMSMNVPGGKTKMDLANLASAQVLDMLTPLDEFGVIAVDTVSHIIASLAPVEKNQNARNNILRIRSMGGGIYVFEALATAAGMLNKAVSQTRHIILFSDAQDSEQPGKYKELIKECRKENITISVIALGTPKDADAALLKDIARRGGGRCFFTEKATDLPRIFAQDTFVVAKSSFIDTATKVKATPELFSLTSKTFADIPTIGGYNLCYLRKGVYPAVISQDKYKAPIVASWRIGLGRVLCYTGEADGSYLGKIKHWSRVKEFFISLARWTAGKQQDFSKKMAITQKTERGICRIEMHLNPTRNKLPFVELPVVNVVRETKDGPRVEHTPMRWSGPDTLTADVTLQGEKTILPTVSLSPDEKVTLAPVCQPYSPEFNFKERNEVERIMTKLARATGGKQRLTPTEIWKEMPEQIQMHRLAQWLLLAAILIFLLEILERRTAMISSAKLPQRIRSKEQEEKVITERKKTKLPGQTLPKTMRAKPQKEDKTKQDQEEPVGGIMAAMQQAKKQMNDRN